MGKIKMIVFYPVDKHLEIQTWNGHKLVIAFRREIYFDVMMKIAVIQRNRGVGFLEIGQILNSLNARAKDLPPLRRQEYGLLESPKSFENYWQTAFQNKGTRKYTILRENPSQLPEVEIKDILSELFRQRGRKEISIFELADSNVRIVLPRVVYEDKTFYVGPTESYLGEQKIDFFTSIVDIERGFSKEDIKLSFLNERLSQPVEIEEYRLELLRDREINLTLKAGQPQQVAWPGPTFSIDSIFEDRDPITEHSTIYLTLRPTDYFVFRAVQYAIKNSLVKDQNGRPQKLKEKYLKKYSPFVPIPELAQSISGTILLVCRERNTEYALLAKRSKKVATGQDVYVLSINETPKRQPAQEDMKYLRSVPPELIKPDLDEKGNPCIFAAIARGAKEEIGVTLPIGTIKVLSFGLETDRYQYVFIGISETDLTRKQIRSAFNEAKDKPLEYSDFFLSHLHLKIFMNS